MLAHPAHASILSSGSCRLRSSGVPKWLANCAAANLPLAARPCVGHIRLNGAVAEWLKAAVC